ncbi:patatin-like phospholipase family protein [Candidatus Poribacteria bacterium]|nr:patatin-like phospholipase family protein [Candidatus Poribacteria bacterium]
MSDGITRVLSIDGGGIKGVLPAAFLAEAETATGKRIVDHFDVIAGTSTGGIIAIGLGLGLSAREILDFYLNKGPAIFYQHPSPSSVWGRARAVTRKWLRSARHVVMPKYDPDRLRQALTEAFGARILGESQTRLVIPAYHALRREVYVFKTAHNPRFQTDWKQRVVDIALATAAAPTYFPSHRMPNGAALIDGGVWANNPVGIAAVETVGVLNRDRERINILSLGCTEETWSVPPRAGGKNLLLAAAGDLFLQGQCKGAIGAAKLLIGHTESDPRLFRYSPTVARGMFDVDTVDMIEELRSLGSSSGREALPLLNKVFLDKPKESFSPFHHSIN